MLTTGTSRKPASMANAPQLMGDCKMGGNADRKSMFKTMMPVPKMKLAQAPAVVTRYHLVTRFQYNPYRNGARNAPAKAPQETPISCAIKVTEF